MRLIDCVTFFEEMDLLEFRLKYLDGVIDYMVVVESNLTHSGKPKPYHIKDNWDRFSRWKNKLIYIQIQQTTDGLSFDEVKTYTPTNGPWILEQQQRMSMMHASGNIADSDLVLVGDLDEIPDVQLLKEIKESGINYDTPISISQLFHYYYMNCQNTGFERWWNGTVISTGKQFKQLNSQTIRDNRNHYPRFDKAGWHFSFLNGPEKIKNKIESFAHTEFNRPDITSDENIQRAIEKGEDIFNRPGVTYEFVNIDQYPEDLKLLMIDYPQFIKAI
jgi:beta-1,4-mannosyl-glycoprotein beta-1,4-N-acetylglucosaminyltransferase